MSYSISMNMQNKQAQTLKQAQRLIMSPQMQQAIHLLQMPVMEISAAIEAELEQNPVLEYSEAERTSSETPSEQPEAETELREVDFDGDDFDVLRHLCEEYDNHFAESGNYHNAQRTQEEEKLRTFQESSIVAASSLYSHLMEQAEHTFASDRERAAAELIIGNLDDKGFFEGSMEELALLNEFSIEELDQALEAVQYFDPYGVGARSLQDSLLIQLRCMHKHDSLAYEIIEHHYDDLLHNRIPVIKKGLGATAEDIRTAIDEDISGLDLNPGGVCSSIPTQHISPDVTIEREGDHLSVRINDDRIPSFRLNGRYLRMLQSNDLPEESREYLKQKVLSGKWLLKCLHQRHDTVERLTEYLVEHQRDFFLRPEGQLKPLTMKTVAESLSVHESTIARAVANKYVHCDRGLVPLRSFFTNAYTTEDGKSISSNTVKDKVKEIIADEDKRKPLSDEAISKLVSEGGVKCARRTVAKYRGELGLGNAAQRRMYT